MEQKKNFPNIKQLINKEKGEEQKEYENIDITEMDPSSFNEIEDIIDKRKINTSKSIDISKYIFKVDYCEAFNNYQKIKVKVLM